MVAGCTFGQLKSADKTVLAADMHTDMLGSCGMPVFPRQNYFFNEALHREENEQQTGITYARTEKLLPVQLYRQLLNCLTNNCVPKNRCACLKTPSLLLLLSIANSNHHRGVLVGKQLKLGELCTEKSFLGKVAIDDCHKYVGYTSSPTCVDIVSNKLWAGSPKF